MGQPLRVRAPTPEENPKLASMAASKDFTGRIRASIVLESSEGARVGKIASKLRLNKHTVRLWIKRFNESGLDGLGSRSPPGRPPSITNGQKDEIVRTALTDPRRLGMSLTTWSLPALRSYLEGKGTVKSISESWIRKILAKKGSSTSGARGGRRATTPITTRR
jgi:transposase